ncbi:FHA domain-containing protein [Rarobacter faecitabidus]|uniref:FHA domain-containing protein n=1 Tax=Rarobacter faecitabidus TaxID=13243 RepID=A0A542ZP98_RARFA|nr:FHA domain-containing protein [Rarobacter faecitabidus]TQL62183.1 FHA domain-containing protein [Rarobacter faecitabidus]
MNELTIALLRIAYLGLMWVLILSVVGVLRRDLYGTRISPRPSRAPGGRQEAGPRRPGAAATEHRVLTVTAGPLEGTTLPLGNVSVVIGRAPDCTLVVDDDYASSRHARIFPDEGRWFVEDLGSTNGTFLNGNPVHDRIELPIGASLQVGQSSIELRK